MCSTLLVLLPVLLCLGSVASAHLLQTKGLIIAHRGAPASHPEETLEGYREAIAHGAHYLEFDLVSTSDHQLVLRHDVTLDDSTNAAELVKSGLLQDKRVTRELDGRNVTGLFVTDYALSDINKLSAIQAMPFRDDRYNSEHFNVPSLDEMLAFFAEWTAGAVTMPRFGLYIELKHPGYHESHGIDIVQAFFDAVQRSGLSKQKANELLVVQCFDLDALARAAALGRQLDLDLPMVWLLDCAAGYPSDADLSRLRALGTYTGIGPDKLMLLEGVTSPVCGSAKAGQSLCSEAGPRHGSECVGRLSAPLDALRTSSGRQLIDKAHALGMVVHPFTLRNEYVFMHLDFHGDPLAEMDAMMALGGLNVDGVFVDAPATAARWRQLRCGVSGAPGWDCSTTADLGEGAREWAQFGWVPPFAVALIFGGFAVGGLLNERRRAAGRYYVPMPDAAEDARTSALEQEMRLASPAQVQTDATPPQ